MAKMDGMLPGEYCEIGTVLVWPKGVGGEIVPEGIQVRPDIFVIVVRARPDSNNELKFTTEVMTTMPVQDGVIQHDVFMRSRTYYDRIVSRRRSDNARDRAASRDDTHSHDKTDQSAHLYEDRNGVHLLQEVEDAG